MSKVKFNIKKLQFVPITSIDESGTPTYGSPLKCPGTVSLSLDPSGEATNFYADGQVYVILGSSTGYTGTLENAWFTKEVLQSIFGYMLDTNKNLVEISGNVKEFGLQFAADNEDGTETRFTLYRASCTKPNINFQTSEDSPTVNPQSVDLTISGITLSDGKVCIKSYAESDATNFEDYFKSITLPTFASA